MRLGAQSPDVNNLSFQGLAVGICAFKGGGLPLLGFTGVYAIRV